LPSSELHEDIAVPKDERGTTITVSDLHDDVKESFRSEREIRTLIRSLALSETSGVAQE
jgi:hypothetical protein